MFVGAYVIAILIALVGGAVAVFLERKLPHRAHAGGWISFVFGLAAVAGFQLATGRLPPVYWIDQASSAEPWELIVVPLLLVSILWPWLRALTIRAPTVRLWLALALVSLPLLLALPVGENYADVLPGNAVWSVLTLLAIGANYEAGEQLDASGASRWSLWVFVAQLFTVAALLMTCYGTLGEWCAIAALALGVLAASRVFIADGSWGGAVGLSATALGCILLMHIRVYSTLALPTWLAPLPMLLPAIVCGVDNLLGRYRSGWTRATTAAITAAIVAVAVVATILSLGAGGGDEWAGSPQLDFHDQPFISAQL